MANPAAPTPNHLPDAKSGGPFTIGRVIHSSHSVGFTGWIGGVAVFDRALRGGGDGETGGSGERCAESDPNPRLTPKAWQKLAGGVERAIGCAQALGPSVMSVMAVPNSSHAKLFTQCRFNSPPEDEHQTRLAEAFWHADLVL